MGEERSERDCRVSLGSSCFGFTSLVLQCRLGTSRLLISDEVGERPQSKVSTKFTNHDPRFMYELFVDKVRIHKLTYVDRKRTRTSSPTNNSYKICDES